MSIREAELVAAWWALRAVRVARRERGRAGVAGMNLPRVPRVPGDAYRAVRAVLRLTRQTCLVESLVRQAWYRAQGRDRHLVVGVTAPSAGFRAHAWLDGDPAAQRTGFSEILRIPP